MKIPKDAIKKTRLGALFLLRGRYTTLSMAIPRTAEKVEAKKKRELA